MGLSRFGEYMRILRIKRGLLMKDTADSLGIKTPFLSEVENGKKNIPSDWYEKLSKIYNLNAEEQENLKKAIQESSNTVKINLLNYDDSKRNLVYEFQRSFPNLDEETTKKIIDLLKGGE